MGDGEAIDKNGQRPRRPPRRRRGLATSLIALRPVERRAVRVGRIGRGEHHHVRLGGPRRPPGDVGGVRQSTQPVDDRGRRKLRRAEPLDDIAAHRFAGFFEPGEHLVGQREPAKHVLGDDAAAGNHAVAVQPRLAVREAAVGRIGRGRNGKRPAPAHIRRGLSRLRLVGLGKRGTAHAQPGAGRPPFRAVRGAPPPALAGQARANGLEGIGGDKARFHQTPDGLAQLGGTGVSGDKPQIAAGAGGLAQQIGEQEGAAALQDLEHRFLQRRQPLRFDLRGELRGVIGGQQHHPRIGSARLAGADNEHLAGGGELVEHRRRVVPDARRQHQGLPRGGRQPHPGELFHHGEHPVGPAQHWALAHRGDLLPVRQEAPERGGADRLGGRPSRRQRLGTDDLQDLRGAVFGIFHPLAVVPLHGAVHGGHRGIRGGDGQAERRGELAEDERAAGARPPADQLAERVLDGLHLRRHSRRDGHAEPVAQQRRVADLGEVLAPGDAHPHGAARVDQLAFHRLGKAGVPVALDVGVHLLHRHGAQHAQQVGDFLGRARPAAVCGALQLGVDAVYHLGIEKLPQLHRAQQLG